MRYYHLIRHYTLGFHACMDNNYILLYSSCPARRRPSISPESNIHKGVLQMIIEIYVIFSPSENLAKPLPAQTKLIIKCLHFTINLSSLYLVALLLCCCAHAVTITSQLPVFGLLCCSSFMLVLTVVFPA